MNKKTKKTMASVMGATILVGGMANIMTIDANADTINKKDKTILNSGVLKQFKDYTQKVGDHTIHYEMLKGVGHPDRTIVLQHGAFGSENFMKVLASKLHDEYPKARIILVDAPWHGESVGPEGLEDATVYTYADVLADFYNELEDNGTIQGKFNYIGWSMGGSIGMILDLKGVQIDELVLLNSSPVWNSIAGVSVAFPTMMNPDTVAPTFKYILEGALEGNMTDAERTDILSHYDQLVSPGKVMAHDMFAIFPENYDIQDQLQNIKAKTLILGGTKDTVAELQYQYMFDEKIPNSELVLFEEDHIMLAKPQIAKQLAENIHNYFGK